MQPTTIQNMNKKLETIEDELYSLKSIIIRVIQQPEPKQILALKGLLKGIQVNEGDIEEAKKSLFNIGA